MNTNPFTQITKGNTQCMSKHTHHRERETPLQTLTFCFFTPITTESMHTHYAQTPTSGRRKQTLTFSSCCPDWDEVDRLRSRSATRWRDAFNLPLSSSISSEIHTTEEPAGSKQQPVVWISHSSGHPVLLYCDCPTSLRLPYLAVTTSLGLPYFT